MTQKNFVKPTFDALGIDTKLLTILQNKKFITPTPIQRDCIPEALNGKDVVGIAQTGTGKTLAFGLPLIQQLLKSNHQSLVLVPTRELAIQIDEIIHRIGNSLNIKTILIIGGTSTYRQIKDLKNNPDIIIATPGRLLDHLNRKSLNLNRVKTIVLDEADKMLDIGFLPDIEKIIPMTSIKRQILLFSATIPFAINKIADKFMKMPVKIEIAPTGTVASNIKQEIFILKREMKISLLEKILSDSSGTILIFSRTKLMTKKIARAIFVMGHSVVEIHSDRSLFQRKQAITGFKSGKFRVLVATDIASRGIDVSEISLVVNYDLPDNSEDYVHRIGRTGRAGSTGRAISFATPDQRRNIKRIESLIRKNISILSLPSLSRPSDQIIKAIRFQDENIKKKSFPFSQNRRRN